MKDIIISTSLLLVYLPRQTVYSEHLLQPLYSINRGLIEVSYNHVYVPVSIRDSKRGCTATVAYKKYKNKSFLSFKTNLACNKVYFKKR
jgi:hypothetical protein